MGKQPSSIKLCTYCTSFCTMNRRRGLDCFMIASQNVKSLRISPLDFCRQEKYSTLDEWSVKRRRKPIRMVPICKSHNVTQHLNYMCELTNTDFMFLLHPVLSNNQSQCWQRPLNWMKICLITDSYLLRFIFLKTHLKRACFICLLGGDDVPKLDGWIRLFKIP